MDINTIKRRHRDNKRILIAIRINKALSNWLRKNDYSPTRIFYEAVKELGFQEKYGSKDMDNKRHPF